MVGSLVLFMVALPVYVGATLVREAITEPGRHESVNQSTVSWKRVGVGLYLALGTLLAAAAFYVLCKSL
ncbi:MAG TPA: hypothetical protein VJR03_00150 [Nitrospira sp.]|nr:hypothetical protein [Nitrospira sp.]